MTHPLIKLLSSFHGCSLLKFKDLFTEEVLKELILIAHFQELIAATLVVIKGDLKLRNSLSTLFANPVVDLLMRTVQAISTWELISLEYFSCPTETLQ